MNINKDKSNLPNYYIKVLDQKYKHFDFLPDINSSINFINNVVINPEEVAKYRFYPFLNYELIYSRYHRSRGKLRAHLKNKKRPISIAAHHDSLIYAHYSELIKLKYERYVNDNGINNIAIAYRKGSNNIKGAKEVFNFIADSNKCAIIKGDFKGFFDNIRHRILKNNLKSVLTVNELSNDWKAVLKSLTKYRYVRKKDVHKSLRKINLNGKYNASYVKSRKDIKLLISKGNLKIMGPNQLGIPQGTSLSAVLANVYMIELDKQINKIVSNMGGIYRRYSDDFIVVIPDDQLSINDYGEVNNDIFNKYNKLTSKIICMSKKETCLDIEQHKTRLFYYDKESKYKKNLVMNGFNSKYDINRPLNYIGFVFDGNVVRFKNNSIYKFHYKSKRIINLAHQIKRYRKLIELSNTSDYDLNKVIKSGRQVWKNGQRKWEKTYQKDKQNKRKKKLEYVKKHSNFNNTPYKKAVQFYLTEHRYGGRYSMIKYTENAQRILEKNNGRYRVDLLKQIKRQVLKNQLRQHKLNLSYNRLVKKNKNKKT